MDGSGRHSALGGTATPDCPPHPTHHLFVPQILIPWDSSIPTAVWEPSPGMALPTPRAPEDSPQPELSTQGTLQQAHVAPCLVPCGSPGLAGGRWPLAPLLPLPVPTAAPACLHCFSWRTSPSFWKNAASRIFSRALPSLSLLSLGLSPIHHVVQLPRGLLAPGGHVGRIPWPLSDATETRIYLLL